MIAGAHFPVAAFKQISSELLNQVQCQSLGAHCENKADVRIFCHPVWDFTRFYAMYMFR